MDAVDLRGGPLAKQVKEAVMVEAAAYAERGIVPVLAVVLASSDASALSYFQSKKKAAAGLGIRLDLVDLGEDVGQGALDGVLRSLSADPQVHGILLEFPLAPGLDGDRALSQMDPHKDVDGLTPLNLGLVASGRESEAIPAATPQACIELAETQGSLVGKKVGVVGRGRTVGRPLASMLINRHATVTVCHTRTRDLREALAHCDVVMVAAGKPGLIRAEHLSTGQIVIDAGINVVTDGLVGDVDAESVRPIAAALTPVPGGVGTLTTAIVFRNLMRAMRLQGVV